MNELSNNASTDLSVLRFSIILKDAAGGTIKSLHTSKIRRAHFYASNYEWATAHLAVKYGQGIVNEGTYASLAELQHAISAFTDPELLRYLREGIEL